MHTYGIIKIKDSLHHTIAKLEHCFTIAFSGAFLAFFSAKRVMTLSKLIFLAISDSMLKVLLNPPNDLVTWLSANSSLQASVCLRIFLLKQLCRGLSAKYANWHKYLGKDFPVYIDKDCLINQVALADLSQSWLHALLSTAWSLWQFTQIGFRGFGKNYQEVPSCLVLPTCLRKNINQFKIKQLISDEHLLR